MDCVNVSLNHLKNSINIYFSGQEPWQIVAFTTSSVLLAVGLYNFIFDDEHITTRAKRTFFRYVRLMPPVKRRIEKQMNKIKAEFKLNIKPNNLMPTYCTELAYEGLSKRDIRDKLIDNMHSGDYNWENGYVSGTVYTMSPELKEIVMMVYEQTLYTNPLHADVFPGICKMEAEIVRMCINLFQGDDDACGCVTSGGTESILMACKAYRDYAKEIRGIRKPEIVVPVTIHSAFDKAAQYFNLRVKSVPVDSNYQVNIDAMRRAISCNTIMLAGSAPNYPYGTVDNIEAISKLGLEYNIPVHVDACLGGFLIVFMSEAGYPPLKCDFRLPGVTSISADTHKYGYAPKGTSVILYREAKYRHYQYTVTTDWPGGVYGSPVMAGSRCGANIAVCWATMMSLGIKGYTKATKEVLHATRYIEKQLKQMNGIFIFGRPQTSVVAIGSNLFHIYRLGALLNEKGWNLNTLQYPPAIHICITHVHTQLDRAKLFVEDVRAALKQVLKHPKKPIKGKMALYGQSQSISDRSIVGDFTRCFIDTLYYTPPTEGK